MKGYYSLIQYCPDSAKAESANIGVLLLCPDAPFCEALFANGNDRVRRFFGLAGEDLERFAEAKQKLKRRLEIDAPRIANLEALEHFIGTRANKLLMTAPRNLRTDVPRESLHALFDELVGGRFSGEAVHRDGRGLSVKPLLKALFSRPELTKVMDANVEVKPLYGRAFRADYAFVNGKDNFVIPQVVHVDNDKTMADAERLAVRGSQLFRHGVDGRAAQLIVPLPDPADRFEEITRNVAAMLKDYEVRTVFASDLDDLAEEIRIHAHRR